VNGTGTPLRSTAEAPCKYGLAEYVQRFAENYIDASVLRDLTDQDLKDLGIPLGHLGKILRSIAELDGTALPPPQIAAEPTQRESAERRQLTVMFCDLVGSTALSANISSTPRTCARSSAHTVAAAPSRSTRRVGSLRSKWRRVLAYFGPPPKRTRTNGQRAQV
jgi:SAM domain (Sterile alpha motif)